MYQQVGNVDNEGGKYLCVDKGGEISVPSPQCCCEPKTQSKE